MSLDTNTTSLEEVLVMAESLTDAATFTVEDIEGGHRVTVKNSQGEQSFDVMDGEQGVPGKSGVVVSETEPEPYEDGNHPVWVNPNGDEVDVLITQADLEYAVEGALSEAKESGAFDGAPGHTPEKGTDYWTEADKQEMVSDLKQITGMGTIYKGAWIVEEASGISQRYTETITLPAGAYVVTVVAPYTADLTARVCIGFSAQLAIGAGNTFIDAAYGTVTMLAKFETTTNLYVMSAASSNAVTWSYLDRGGIAAVRIA